MVTLDFFKAAEVPPLLGRVFVDADSKPFGHRVVVLSHLLWVERFASSPTTMGRSIDLDGRPAIVVGVAPRGFRFPEGAMLWTMKDGAAP